MAWVGAVDGDDAAGEGVVEVFPDDLVGFVEDFAQSVPRVPNRLDRFAIKVGLRAIRVTGGDQRGVAVGVVSDNG